MATGFPSPLTPHVLPLTRSIGAPWAPLVPARSHTENGGGRPTDAFVTSDNLTYWDPWTGGDNLTLYAHDDPRPLRTRPAIGLPFVTPSALWNLAGVAAGGLSGGEWPIVKKLPNGGKYYQFGFPTPGQQPWDTGAHVKRNLPGVPPPVPFLSTGV